MAPSWLRMAASTVIQHRRMPNEEEMEARAEGSSELVTVWHARQDALHGTRIAHLLNQVLGGLRHAIQAFRDLVQGEQNHAKNGDVEQFVEKFAHERGPPWLSGVRVSKSWWCWAMPNKQSAQVAAIAAGARQSDTPMAMSDSLALGSVTISHPSLAAPRPETPSQRKCSNAKWSRVVSGERWDHGQAVALSAHAWPPAASSSINASNWRVNTCSRSSL